MLARDLGVAKRQWRLFSNDRNYEKLAERVSHSLIFPVKWYMIVLCEKNNLIFFTYMGKREKAKSANQVAEMLNIDRSTLYRK